MEAKNLKSKLKNVFDKKHLNSAYAQNLVVKPVELVQPKVVLPMTDGRSSVNDLVGYIENLPYGKVEAEEIVDLTRGAICEFIAQRGFDPRELER